MNDLHLDALLVNRKSDTLVVSLHGALDRKRYRLPRFERLASIDQFSVSALYISDPSLWVDDELTLAWYAGWPGMDLYPRLATLINDTAKAIDAKNIVLTGSSGGGFASLQISALIDKSLAIVFNPQTSIYAYEHPKWPHMPQRWLLRKIWNNLPGIDPEKFDFSYDWTEQLGDRLSAVRRYMLPRKNYVYYLNNTQDTHHLDKHFSPLAKVLRHVNSDHFRVENYVGGEGHRPPSPYEFHSGLTSAASWRGFSLS
ncbi:hypothetical protein [Arthrobacter sp. 'calajunan']|uniref:hypothetical protein n=1 Tax=Arthrobacter sp. 'calajunan' TaxID=1690248 RepID=UPI003C74FEA8